MSYQNDSERKKVSRKTNNINRVRKHFDPAMLTDILERDSLDFNHYGQRYEIPGEPSRFYYYIDRGSDILAVAHLDSVCDDGTATIAYTADGPWVGSGTLDDRLGAYVILELLPRLGVTCDVLLTTDEERGASTAEIFHPDKTYKWIIQFDRGGTDVVMYDYETPEYKKMVTECGVPVGSGSFSDICMLESMGVAAFNWGVGYRDYHGPRAYAWLNDTFHMVGAFLRFHAKHKDTTLPHDPRPKFRGHWWDKDDDNAWTYYRDNDKKVNDTNPFDALRDAEGDCPGCGDWLDDEQWCNRCSTQWLGAASDEPKRIADVIDDIDWTAADKHCETE